jgi:hypothetical protein
VGRHATSFAHTLTLHIRNLGSHGLGATPLGEALVYRSPLLVRQKRPLGSQTASVSFLNARRTDCSIPRPPLSVS